MGLRDLKIEPEYRSLLGDVVKDFYTPVLSESVLYRRAVGFFSSSSLICLTAGIRRLVENGGKIEVIASPRLTSEDIDAINDGLARRDDVVRECLIRSLDDPQGPFEEARLNLLSNLIAAGILTIKIAIMESNNRIGMFHEKLGIMQDSVGDVVVFAGSMNESANAFYQNYESIDVFASWTSDEARVRCKVSAFNAMWNDYEPNIKVLEFPEVSERFIEKYKISEGIDFDLAEDEPCAVVEKASSRDEIPLRKGIPSVPDGVNLREYQLAAITEWERCGFRGIFDMATGTGKTYTALAAVAHLSEKLSHNLATVIVCPYQHLVEQWREDIVRFGMNPIVCYSSSKQVDWRDRVKTRIDGFRAGVTNSLCIVTTNATFATGFMQSQVARLKGNCLLVVDEAHNFGALRKSAVLPEAFPFRLALSATIERHGDEDGTQRIFEYFGKKCIEYTLKDAISNKMLTPYYYHPICVSLSGTELEEYLELSKKIRKAVGAAEKMKVSDLPESVKMLLIKRARVVAAASSKLDALDKAIAPYKDDSHILVYCGATTVADPDYSEGSPDDSDIRQIDAVVKRLSSLGMKVAKFTSEENAEKREILKEKFSEGRHQQALIAIRCLDEGVNIPGIRTAFILASSTNPKEYIQRRGRVLRKAKGKDYAVIYDFITLPFPLSAAKQIDAEIIELSKSLAVREVTRMMDFAEIAENPSDADALISEIVEKYDISLKEEWGEDYV